MPIKNNIFNTILIANRGEIACRVIRTAKAMGLRTVAVYSDADANSLHVKMANDAVNIGPAPVSDSYLCIDKIIEASKATGAGAIHPGYGFLSENAGFAKACADAGIIFIGPTPDAIEIMGDKAKAKRRMIDAGVPCVPGYQGEDQSDATLLKEADAIGFPIMVKAAAGGGGRGMRLVEEKSTLADAIKTARSEAENAFGSVDLILERAVIEPRHVELQIFADSHGNVIHLGERDCSVQRRHQKVIEEAPSPVVNPDLRERMGAAAVKAARDINYVGAGTVEFLLDASDKFYFLEMNTRLQVEHPVTEMVTGLDLVAMQIRVARGEKMGLEQKDVSLNGHAIEARLYAEDVGAGFLPATGRVDFWRPENSDSVRTDAGIETGNEVSPYYDPMIAKIIAHGATRDEARRKLIGALDETAIFGVTTNRRFLIEVLSRDQFMNDGPTTAFIAQNFTDEDLTSPALSKDDAAIAAVLLFHEQRRIAMAQSKTAQAALCNWASATKIETPFQFEVNGEMIDQTVAPRSANAYCVRNGDEQFEIDIDKISDNDATLSANDARKQITFNYPASAPPAARIQLSTDGCDFDLTNLNAVFSLTSDASGAGAVLAPMHGLLVELFAKPGQSVAKGEKLAVLEAMKMQHELVADIKGIVGEIHFAAGDQAPAGGLLMEIKSGED
ncbi:MAG: acetyl-CoA carboxylase biotin carboxylase subunit [Marinicaulis sp.]|nr:acetyl-CoA carboxylase biotin carboxylase subunit [Marinicaulis sp.]NNL87885.1 acetyl-CoA carboxylase biotin carboxylase subunit [Marinicaulis sp.]